LGHQTAKKDMIYMYVLNDSWDRPTSQVPIFDHHCFNTFSVVYRTTELSGPTPAIYYVFDVIN